MEMAETYDLIIIGGGPAGLTAYLYAARARLKTLLLEKLSPGGQVLTIDFIENYPGFPDGIRGWELIEKFVAQVEKLGLERLNAEVNSLTLEDNWKVITLANGQSLKTKAVIVATGASPRRLGIPGEQELVGKGVSYCATCDGPFFTDQVVAVVGGGNTAVQEAIFLTKFAKKVYLIHRRDQLRAQKILQERALANEKIEFIWNTVVKEVIGKDYVEAVRLFNRVTEEERLLPVDGLFIFVGLAPQTSFLEGLLELDERGFIVTDAEMRTNVPGIFAAGDVRSKACRQIITAAGDGAVAAYMAEHYIANFAL